MNQYNKFVTGQVVRSLQGRDKGMILMVYGILDHSHVLVVDGKKRKLDNPKKKKTKHLQGMNVVLKPMYEDLKDAHIRKMLKDYDRTKEDIN